MPIRLPEHRLAYFPIPKVACTSLKHVFHELKHGKPFARVRRPGGVLAHIHNVYPSVPFTRVRHEKFATDAKLVVVREPTLRLLSAYRNRVLHHWELSAKGPAGPALQQRGLPADPDLETFVERLSEYRELVRSIRHHTEPQVTFTGRSLSFFDQVFEMEHLDGLERFLASTMGRSVTLPRMQTGGPSISLSALSPSALARVIEFYADDYELLGDHYDPRTLSRERDRAAEAER